MTKSIVPNVTEARAAAKADRDAKEAKKTESITQERTLLYGQVLEMIENAMKNDNIDDIAFLKQLLEHSSEPSAPEQPKQKQSRFSGIKKIGRNIANG